MKPKHTAGPWTVFPEECDKPYIRIRGTNLGYRFKIANVLTPVYAGVPECEAEETRANARLIAAAPELLEALEQLVDCHDEPECPGVIFAKEIIAKVTCT